MPPKEITITSSKPGHEWLKAHFPAVFDQPCPPLQIGATDMIMARKPKDVSSAAVALALGEIIGGRAYVAGVALGGPRYDLDGNPVGMVTEAEKAQAAARILRMGGPNPEVLAEQAEAKADKQAEQARIAAKKAERAEIKRLVEEAKEARAEAKRLKEEAKAARAAAQ